ncbi:MAG: hypothetical protein AABZ44_00435 [Elusimicrobiota bacterium]
MHLSKSSFASGLQCVKLLWLGKHRRDLKTEPDDATKAIFSDGTQVGNLAKELYPGGVEIVAEYYEYGKALALTQIAAGTDAPALYEAAASFDDIFVRADILKRNANGHWDLIEVKRSTREKAEHLPDVAIQVYVLDRSGFTIDNAYLMLVDNASADRNPKDPKPRFKLIDMTAKAKDYEPKLPEFITKFKGVLAGAEPKIAVGGQCDSPYQCPFKEYCGEMK